jgi:DNA-binding IscR family transcriptional regulator
VQECSDYSYAKRIRHLAPQIMGSVRDAIADILDNYALADFAAGSKIT